MAQSALLIITISRLGSCQAQSNTTDTRREGWVSQPNGRGTFDILWSCLFTVFLCTWTVLHLNIKARHETYWHQFRRKLRWMLQAIIGPEFVLAFATGQKVEAWRSVDSFKKAGYTKWTSRHGFYANMGGFHLQTPDGFCFPINAKQLLYLIKEGHTELPKVTEKELWDKSKADGFQKTLTCVQTGWFIIQVIGRAIQGLPVTTMELTTLSFVFCSLAMYLQWANKPLDVETPTVIEIDKSMEEILVAAGPAAKKPYRQTPLDFIDNQSPSWLTEVQPHLRFRRGPSERPLPRFTNDRFPVIAAGPDAIILFAVNMAYCAMHFIGWNFSFPTEIERNLWRASSIAILGCAFVFWMCETYQDGCRIGRWKRWYEKLFPEKARVAAMNNAEKGEKEMPFVPLWEVILMTPFSCIYTLARTYIVIEIFLSQRSLPSGAFDSVQWSEYIPHF